MLNTSPTDHSPHPDSGAASTTPVANPRQILTTAELKTLSQQSNIAGLLQLTGHLAIMGGSGYLWLTHWPNIGVMLPALVVYGFSLASMFAVVHECVHRTAFKSNRLNDVVGWFAGCLSLYNSTFFRRYHKWHHRFTRIPGKDPELTDLQPTNWREYLLQISALPWWFDKVRGHWQVASGQVQDYPFLSSDAYADVIRSTRLQLSVYGLALLGFSLFGHPEYFVLSWVLPLAIGQPLLRCILLAEHTDCNEEDNPLTNTRTTLTLWPIRYLMWNMPFHTEHHLHLSIPFHQLPTAHGRLKTHFIHVDPGYIHVNRKILAALPKST